MYWSFLAPRDSKKIDLYLGGYFNYGLNNILTPDTKHIFLQDGTYNGILASNQTDKVIPVSVGVKIGIYWQQGEKSSLAISKTISEPFLKTKETSVLKEETVDSVPKASATEPTAMQEVVPAPAEVKEEVVKVEEGAIRPTEKVAVSEPIVVLEKPKIDTGVQSAVSPNPLIKARELAVSITKDMLRNSIEPNETDRLKTTTGINNQVKELSDLLIANPDFKLYLVGHTDNKETPANSLKVSLKKALLARQSFVKNSVPIIQLVAKTKGQYAPLFANTTVENKKKNNRIELKVGRISNASK